MKDLTAPSAVLQVYEREVKMFKEIGDEGEVWYALSQRPDLEASRPEPHS